VVFVIRQLRDLIGQLRRAIPIRLAGPVLREVLDGREAERG
jgi:hypothetical protein